MIVRLVLWNLADSLTTIGELRRYLRDESVGAFEKVPGLLFKAWISDETTERFGVVETWDGDPEDFPREIVDLIGKDPEIAEEFDVEG